MSDHVLDACGIEYSKVKDKTILSTEAMGDFAAKVRETRNMILVCKAWFGVLLLSRDLVLGATASRFGFSADILWAGEPKFASCNYAFKMRRVGLTDDTFDSSSKALPNVIASFIIALERELQLVPLDKLPRLLNSLRTLLSNLSMQVSWAAYNQSLDAQKEELGVLDLLLAEIMQCCNDEGLSTNLSLKQLEKDRTRRLKEETKADSESSVAGTLVYLHKDLIVWLRQSLSSVLSLPRGRLVSGILHVTQACVDEVMTETHSDLRKRLEFS